MSRQNWSIYIQLYQPHTCTYIQRVHFYFSSLIHTHQNENQNKFVVFWLVGWLAGSCRPSVVRLKFFCRIFNNKFGCASWCVCCRYVRMAQYCVVGIYLIVVGRVYSLIEFPFDYCRWRFSLQFTPKKTYIDRFVDSFTLT